MMGRTVDITIRAGRFANGAEGLLTRLVRGVPHSALSIADQIVASATTFITGALIGRICTKEEFGYYTIAFSVLTLLMTVQSSVVSTPFMIRFPRLAGEEAQRFCGSSLIHQFVFACTVSAFVFAAGAAMTASGIILGQTIQALGSALAFLLLRDYVRQTCFARLAFAQALALDMLLASLQLGGLAVLYLAGLLHAWTAILVLGAACALTGAHWFLLTRRDRAYSRERAKADLTENWSTGKWLLASGLVWALSMNLYAWIVAGFHGAATAGTWAAALGVMTLINPLMLGVQNYLGPRIMHARAQGGIAHLRSAVRNAAFAFCAMLLAFSLAMVFVGDVLVSAIYGAKYAGNGGLVVLLSLNAAVLTVGFAVSRGLFALEQAHIDFYVNFIALACFLVIGVALVRYAGPVGAAVAQLATNLVATAVRCAAFVYAGRQPAGATA